MKSKSANRFSRLWQHWQCDLDQARLSFGESGFARIEQAIIQGERRHRAEVRVSVESALDAYQIWAEVTPRQRALLQFSKHRLWDTEENNGVLIYLLLADRAVEIVVDRDASRKISALIWKTACDEMSKAFAKGQFVDGVLHGLAIIHPALEIAYPNQRGDFDELPNTVLFE